MKIKHLLFVVVACTLAVAGCKKPEPIVEPDSITVDPSALTFDGKAAGSAQVTVTANTSWSASGAPSWVTVTPSSGSTGTAKVTVSVEAGVEQARNASIVFTAGKASKTVEISQAAGDAPAVPSLSGEVTQVELQAEQTEATFKIIASNLKGKWTVTPKATYDWVSDFTKEGTTSGNIVVKVSANTTANDRTAEFTVAAEGVSNVALTLVQKGAASQPDGTIKTADELIAWLASPTQDAQLGADIDLTGKTFVSDTLRATFNGNGHKITYSITLESADRQNHYVGLFPQINGTVKNLVTAGKIICNPAHDESEGADNTYFVGGIAAILAPKAIIENCQNGVDVISETQLSHRLGGIVGYAGAGAKISGCKNTGKIEAVIPNKGTGNASQIAGIVGHFEETGSISNCVNDGNILYSALGTVRAAGIVGYINNLVDFTIDGCTNNGNIVSDYLWKSGYTYIGGISGYFGTPTAEGKILYKDCVNNGRIEANGPADGCARPGGIASYGGNSNNPANGNELRFVNCTNNGEIISTGETAKKNPVGGIIGQAEKSAKLILDGCTMNGMVSTNSNYAGGLIGQTGGTESVIKDCVVTDKVVIKAKAAGSAIGLFGGSNAKYTTAVSGKVQGGTIEVAGETTKVTESNYQSLLFGVALGTGGSTSGVSFGK